MSMCFREVDPGNSVLALIRLPVTLLPFHFVQPIHLHGHGASSVVHEFIAFL